MVALRKYLITRVFYSVDEFYLAVKLLSLLNINNDTIITDVESL